MVHLTIKFEVGYRFSLEMARGSSFYYCNFLPGLKIDRLLTIQVEIEMDTEHKSHTCCIMLNSFN